MHKMLSYYCYCDCYCTSAAVATAAIEECMRYTTVQRSAVLLLCTVATV
jgi:hypothetical protein